MHRARLVKRAGTLDIFFYETARQGDVLAAPGVRWARSHCHVRTTQRASVKIVRVSACREHGAA